VRQKSPPSLAAWEDVSRCGPITMRKSRRMLPFSSCKILGRDSKQYQEGHTSVVYQKGVIIYLFF